MPPEAGRLRVKVRKIENRTDPSRSGVNIIVADNGSGIAPEHMPRIFESFYTTKQEIGTGLGLWLTRNIVHKYNGKIRVRSRVQPGRSGTIFSVFWPAMAEPKTETAAARIQ
jgi:signal transduction histidine kinase